MYVFTTLQTVFSAGLPGIFAYFIPRLSSAQGKTLVNRFTLVLGLLGASFSIVLYFSSTFIAQILNNPELSTGLKIFSLVPLFTLPVMGVEGIYTALRKTKSLSIYLIICKLFNFIAVVVPVFLLKGSYKTAIIGWTVASFLIFIFTLWMKNRPYVTIKPELVPNMYKMVFNYSMPLMGASIVALFLHSANQFFISRYYGTVVFAEFSNGFIPVPFVGMIAGSVRSVLMPLFSKANFDGNMEQINITYKNAVSKMSIILLPLIFFCMFFARDIMIFIYGSQYAVSKTYFQISLCKDICDILPYIAIMLAFGKPKVYFYMHLSAALFIWIVDAFIVHFHLHPVYIAVASSATQILMVSFVYFYFNYFLKLKLIKLVIQKALIISIHSSVLLTVIYMIRNVYLNNIDYKLSLIICGFMFCAILIATGKILKIHYLESISNLIKK